MLLACLPYGKLERTASFIITLTALFLQSAPALDLKLPHLAGQPFDAVLLQAGLLLFTLKEIPAVQLARARADGEIVFYRLK